MELGGSQHAAARGGLAAAKGPPRDAAGCRTRGVGPAPRRAAAVQQSRGGPLAPKGPRGDGCRRAKGVAATIVANAMHLHMQQLHAANKCSYNCIYFIAALTSLILAAIAALTAKAVNKCSYMRCFFSCKSN